MRLWYILLSIFMICFASYETYGVIHTKFYGEKVTGKITDFGRGSRGGIHYIVEYSIDNGNRIESKSNTVFMYLDRSKIGTNTEIFYKQHNPKEFIMDDFLLQELWLILLLFTTPFWCWLDIKRRNRY